MGRRKLYFAIWFDASGKQHFSRNHDYDTVLAKAEDLRTRHQLVWFAEEIPWPVEDSDGEKEGRLEEG